MCCAGMIRNQEKDALVTESSPAGYVFEQNVVDRERLRLASGLLNQVTSETCVRAGIRPGAHVIGVGCGQLGALTIVAELVGPSGVVVGLDSSAVALAAARDGLASMGLNAVHLVEADINTLSPAVLAAWVPFDVAICRLLLTHQRDPVATLRAVARLMRPGGRIIAMEPLRDQGFPRFDPPIPAVERIRELDIAHLRARGLPWDLAWEYGDVFPAAGLRLLEWRGHLSLFTDDTTFLEFFGKLLPAQKPGLLAAGLTTEAEIDQLTAEIDAALARPLRRSAPGILVDAIAEVPA
jgi:SAM-dependent methyltransferase